MAEGSVKIDYPVCMACSICIQVCPFTCLENSLTGLDQYNKVYPQLRDDHHCTGCGICATACPVNCIVVYKNQQVVA